MPADDGPFIFVDDGTPTVERVLPEWRPTRLWVMRRSWDRLHGFGRTTRYRAVVRTPPAYGVLARALAHSVYDPRVPVAWEWQPTGGYDAAEIVALVEAGLERDDDGIQQWFDGEDVLKLLRAGTSHERMVLAVGAICGAHETDPQVRRFVESVMPVSAGAARA